MELEYDGTTHAFHDGKAGIHHMVMGSNVVAVFPGQSRDNIKLSMWVMESVSVCVHCRRENVIPGECVPAVLGVHEVEMVERKRELVILLGADDILRLATGLMRDACLAKFGSG